MADEEVQSHVEVDDDSDYDSALGESVLNGESPVRSTKVRMGEWPSLPWLPSRSYVIEQVLAFSFADFYQEYLYPNDETEAEREDMKHHVFRLLLMDEIQMTQFEASPSRVLGIGTGTADAHSASHVLAVDLSPIQPDFIPPNLEFQIDNVEGTWTYGSQTLDFIHVRSMGSEIRDWSTLLGNCQDSLRRGGKIEVADFDLVYTSDDGTVKADNPLAQFFDTIDGAANRIGCDLRIISKMGTMLEEAGFVKIQVQTCKLPLGPWPKDRRLKTAGYLHRRQFLQGLGGIAMGLLTRVLGWQAAEVELYLIKIRKAVGDRKIHGYWQVYFVTAEV